MEFILSQSARAKAKIAKAYPPPVTPEDKVPNKGVTYDWKLSEEDVSKFYYSLDSDEH